MAKEIYINTDKLQSGMRFKNYKEMCKILDMEVKESTNSKNAQYKTLAQFCEFAKEGHVIIIKEVFSEKHDRIDNRGGRYTDVYNSLMQIMLLNFFLEMDSTHITISRNRLLEGISALNINYIECRDHLVGLSKHTNVSLDIIFEFYSVTNSNFKSMLDSALNTLQDRSLIKFHETVKVAPSNGSNNRTATKEELSIIADCEDEVLSEMGYKKLRDVRMSSNWKKFKANMSKKLHECKSGIRFYYTAYDIGTVSKNKLEIELDKLNEDNKDKLTLNDTIQVNLKKNAIQRYEEALSDDKDEKKSTRYRKLNNYIPDYNSLVDLLILEFAKEIYRDVKSYEQKTTK